MTQNKSLCMKSDELEVYIKLLKDVNCALRTLKAYHSQFSHILPDDVDLDDISEFISCAISFTSIIRKSISELRKIALSDELKQTF